AEDDDRAWRRLAVKAQWIVQRRICHYRHSSMMRRLRFSTLLRKLGPVSVLPCPEFILQQLRRRPLDIPWRMRKECDLP
ncbi:MAG TPA: hypothetical protein VGM43_07685, partial [Bryobacteraceae bacterium]